MDKSTEAVIEKLVNFTPQNNDWFELEEILEQLYRLSASELGLDAMLSVYERYPDEDNDILWGMLHGIEYIDNYELKVIESLNRSPSFFGILMINRMINADISSVGSTKLIDVLKSVAVDPFATDNVKRHADRFIQRQSEENK